MSIFGNIMNKIFHHPTAQQQQPAPAQAAPQSAPAGDTATATAAPPTQSVDVGAVLSEMAAAKGGGGNYQTSIVDLLKLLDLDSSLGNRKQLAKDLNYTGDTNDSASMNIWLHKQVMDKLAANSGKATADLMKK